MHALPVAVPELQGTIESIAKEKCRLAARQLGSAAITEDTALCFDAMGELPGPYIKWFLEELGHDGLNRMLSGWDNRAARAVCTIAYAAGPDAEPVLFQGITKGRIVPARGPATFGWDPIFEPEHESGLTYAEMGAPLKNTLSHRAKALQLLKDHFAKG